MKQKIRLEIGFAFFAVLGVLPSCSADKLSVEEAAKIHLPVLVECRDEVSCDRDEEHLETFVASFYQWYVDNRNAMLLSRLGRTEQEQQNIIYRYADEQQAVFRKSFTPEFLFFSNRGDGYDGQGNSILCSDSDDDTLLCSYDFPDEFFAMVSAHLDTMDNNMCWLTVSFPAWRAAKKINPPYKIMVRLRVYDYVWRIDRVTDLLSPAHDDK
jgi:hypothetical protein